LRQAAQGYLDRAVDIGITGVEDTRELSGNPFQQQLALFRRQRTGGHDHRA
jgi:hypothetical protein